jgi:hypothetical protein
VTEPWAFAMQAALADIEAMLIAVPGRVPYVKVPVAEDESLVVTQQDLVYDVHYWLGRNEIEIGRYYTPVAARLAVRSELERLRDPGIDR